MTQESDFLKLQLKVDQIEGDVRDLVVAVRENARILHDHLRQEEDFHRQFTEAMLENTKASTQLSTRLDALVDEMREPLEDFKMRKYGMAWAKQMISNSKVILVIVLGLASLGLFQNLHMVITFMEKIL